MLVSPPVLHIPVLGKPFVVSIDTSNNHIGAVLEQSGQPVAFFAQIVFHRVQPSSDWWQTPSYLPSISAVALLPAWGWVSSGLYRSKSAGASVYSATVEPMLDTLGREASWVPPGHTIYCWPRQYCCWWTLVTTCYYQVAACLWSYFALVFAWLVGIGCSACRSGLVHFCWCVRTSGILHALDPSLYQVLGIALVS